MAAESICPSFAGLTQSNWDDVNLGPLTGAEEDYYVEIGTRGRTRVINEDSD